LPREVTRHRVHVPPHFGVEPLTRTQPRFHVGRQAIPLSPSLSETLVVLPVPVPRGLAVSIIKSRVMLAIPLVAMPTVRVTLTVRVMLTVRVLPVVLR
jgi:hypothetical protein